MQRRAFLASMAAISLPSVVRSARAQAPSTRLKSIARDARGTTLTLGLDNAPFPCPGGAYEDDTVIVFVPAHYRYFPDEGVATVVHMHGHSTTAEHAVAAHELREQLTDSRQNAVLVVPQLAVDTADSACGKLETAGGLSRMLHEAVQVTAHEGRVTLGEARFSPHALLGTVCVSAHSGGYHAAARSLTAGGLDVRETYLFDSLYAEIEAFRDWVIARRGQPLHRRHKLVSFYVAGTATDGNNRQLRSQLEHASVLTADEEREGDLSRHELSHAEAVFVRTDVFHSAVTWETNALRDCLFASALPRHLSSQWYAHKLEPRAIDRRELVGESRPTRATVRLPE